MRENINFFLRLRHLIEHRYVPELDPLVTPQAQAMLLNFETVITEEFGSDYALGDSCLYLYSSLP